jgi:hypothetical protein
MYAISKVDQDTGLFNLMEDEIHVDEKWFYLTESTARFIMVDDEDDPHRALKSKATKEKVMFLSAVAKPRYDPHRKAMWDGKLGLWPFAKLVPAQRNSINRPAGTLEWKSYNVDRKAYREMMIEKLLPAIKEKWPRGTASDPIRIQQDNAKSHMAADDVEFAEAAKDAGLSNVSLYCQPPNSPDTNINDLAFFRSIQSLQHKIGSGNNAGTLIASVEQAFAEYPWKKLRNAFLTLQCCLNDIIECHGDNDYKIKHMNKEGLERQGKLPTTIRATQTIEQFIGGDDGHFYDDMEE